MTKDEALKVLKEHNQIHVMEGFDELSAAQQEMLLSQIADLKWEEIALAGNQKEIPLGEITPIEGMDMEEVNAKKDEFEKLGLDAIKEGKLPLFYSQIGMGTRLGLDKPKG